MKITQSKTDTPTPTDEQSHIIDAYRTGDTVAVEALAGTGKTATLDMLARDNYRTRMTYVAFNRAIADEAHGRFPSNVTSATMHSFAFHAVGQQFGDRIRDSKRVPAWRTREILSLPQHERFGETDLMGVTMARLVIESVGRYCRSAQDEIGSSHVPSVTGASHKENIAIADYLIPYVRTAWGDLTREDGQLRFTHDVYLKLWALTNPTLPGTVVLADEYQDSDPVIQQIIESQNAQIIAVGDSNQQIYEWRGAIDALAQIDAPYRLPLQQSFRFGPEIASEANRVLDSLPTELRVKGTDSITSGLYHLPSAQAILTRTNAGCIQSLISELQGGHRAAVVGGTQAIKYLADSASKLISGQRVDHPDLAAFATWQDVERYVTDDAEGKDLKVLVDLVQEHGPEELSRVAGLAVDEKLADVVISTAHKSKGRQWNTVRIASDFRSYFSDEGDVDAGNARLQYVAVTRARYGLDSESLGWIGERAFIESPEEILDDQYSKGYPVAGDDGYQLVLDPDRPTHVMFVHTPYDPACVAEMRKLPGRWYHPEYAGESRVNTARATTAAIQLAHRYGLLVSPAARQRCQGGAGL